MSLTPTLTSILRTSSRPVSQSVNVLPHIAASITRTPASARWMTSGLSRRDSIGRTGMGMNGSMARMRMGMSARDGRWEVSRRQFSGSAVTNHGDLARPKPGTGIKFTFSNAKGTEVTEVEGNEGDDLLSLAHEWDVDLEGACEGSIACSTCHVILSPEHYDKLDEPSDDENDMLDLAFGLSDTSRLGCQVHLTKDMEGMTATLPSATRNMYIDGHKPTPH